VLAARRSTDQLEDTGELVHIPYSALPVLLLGPSLLLTVYGALLFRRDHSALALLAALGFAAVFLGGAAGFFMSYKVSSVYNSSGALAASEITASGWMWHFANYARTLGTWTASLALLWHLKRTSAASSNHPLERTRS
jgi:hypothetical protein